MQKEGAELRLAATDISNHLACRHLTQLDRAVAEGRLAAPSWSDPSLALLQKRGFEHERAFIKHLRAQGLKVVEPEQESGKLSVDQALQAMRPGRMSSSRQSSAAGAGSAGRTCSCAWRGRATLGDWSYEVADTKLAQETRAGTVLQLCLYSELVAEAQGRAPEWMHVVKPGPRGGDFTRERFRFDDYGAYYRLVRRRLEEVIAAPPSNATYPDPVEHCGICRWWKECDQRRHADDKLCLVAGIRPLHIGELERQGIHTLMQYAEEPKPLRQKPGRGSPEAFARAHGQARIQLDGRRAGEPRYELLAPEPGLGFFQLPEPDPGDVFFDIESDPFAGDEGMEYLLGFAFAGTAGVPYRALWGLNPAEERRAIEDFIDFVMDRWKSHPGMHVYHFSPYEPGAVKRLIGRYGTREAELDRLLRAERFVDLLAVTRHGVRASVESYSLKALEQFFGFNRALELPAAGAALRRIDRALELGSVAGLTPDETRCR